MRPIQWGAADPLVRGRVVGRTRHPRQRNGIGLGVKDFGAVFVFSSKDNLRAFVESEGCRRQIR